MRAILPTTLLALTLAAAACGGSGDDAAQNAAANGAANAAAPTATEGAMTAAAAGEARELPPVLVYKEDGCQCCNEWVEHLRAAGFQVDARNTAQLASIKADAGVTEALASCHTALIDGYVVEGHVPADVIERMLAERPDIAGLSVPGMVEGSPGMEGPNPRPYQVVAFDHQGNTSVYAEIDPR